MVVAPIPAKRTRPPTNERADEFMLELVTYFRKGINGKEDKKGRAESQRSQGERLNWERRAPLFPTIIWIGEEDFDIMRLLRADRWGGDGLDQFKANMTPLGINYFGFHP